MANCKCGKPADEGYRTCAKCRESKNAAMARRRQRLQAVEGVCNKCGSPAEVGYRNCERCRRRTALSIARYNERKRSQPPDPAATQAAKQARKAAAQASKQARRAAAKAATQDRKAAAAGHYDYLHVVTCHDRLRFHPRPDLPPELAAGLKIYYATSGEAVAKADYWLTQTADPETRELITAFRWELLRARGNAHYLESTHGDEGEGLYFRQVNRTRDDEEIERISAAYRPPGKHEENPNRR